MSANAPEHITVLLADDHPIFLAGLRSILREEQGIEIVGEAASGAEAIARIADLKPRVSILDLMMPDMNGITVLQQLRRSAIPTRAIMLTVSDDPALASQAIRHGARGYLLKRSARENLAFAIRSVSRNGLYVDPFVAERIMSSGQDRRPGGAQMPSAPKQLTPREADVLRRFALGYTTKEIAAQIGVTSKSVDTYKVRATEKLQLSSRAKVVQFGMLQGWFDTPGPS